MGAELRNGFLGESNTGYRSFLKDPQHLWALGTRGLLSSSRTGKVNGSLETLPGSLRGEERMGVESNLVIISVVHTILLWVKGKSRVRIGPGRHIKEGEGASCF